MIDLSVEGGVWLVTLNRPEKANSLTAEMLETLRDIAIRAGREGARALILTGTGRVFSAGADLDAARAGLATSPLWDQLSHAIAALSCPTVAALNGTLAGGGMGMALACDMRIAVPGAKVFYPVMRLGFLPQPGDVPRLVRLVGPARASMILMAGQKVEVDMAMAWGLIDQVVSADDLLDHARALVADAVSATPAHAGAIKAMIWGQDGN